MNTKNKTLAIVFDTRILSVARNVNTLQLALFGLGYKWNRFDTQPVVVKMPQKLCVIYLNHDTKSLSWDSIESTRFASIEVLSFANIRVTANNLVEVLDFVENPPMPPVPNVHVVEVHGSNQISFVVNPVDKTLEVTAEDGHGRGIRLPVATETVVKVSNALGVLSNAFPVVRFTYPSSSNGLPVVRTVRVTFANDEYVRGYELVNEDDETGTFKAFQQKKIRGKVELLSFRQSPVK